MGKLAVPLKGFDRAAALTLSVQVGEAVNRWPHWVYPPSTPPDPENVHVTRKLDKAAVARLEAGGRVLLLAHGLRKTDTARTGFHSVFWSAGWWGNRFSSLGILCDPMPNAPNPLYSPAHGQFAPNSLGLAGEGDRCGYVHGRMSFGRRSHYPGSRVVRDYGSFTRHVNSPRASLTNPTLVCNSPYPGQARGSRRVCDNPRAAVGK